MRPSISVVLILLAGFVAWRTLRPRHPALRQAQTGTHEDCAVSECGADGVPLSLYAG